MQVDFAILTAAQVDPVRGIRVAEQCEYDISVAMSAIARQTIYAIDTSKFLPSTALVGLVLPLAGGTPVIVTEAAPQETGLAIRQGFTLQLAE